MEIELTELMDLIIIQNKVLDNILIALSVLIIAIFFILAFNLGKSLISGWFSGI